MTEGRFAILSGGGTAGHVLPALSIGEALVERGHPRSSLAFVGSRRGLEATLLPKSRIDVILLPGRGIVRGKVFSNAAAVAGLAVAVVHAFAIVARERPRVVVSLGGYAAFPCALAAVLRRVPLVQTTVDAVPGAVNRLFGRLARANAVALEGTRIPRAVVTGAPVRREVLDVRDRGRGEARRELGLPEAAKMVLAFGGSLGARRINEAVITLAHRWRGRSDTVIHHVIGRRDWPELRARGPSGGEGGLLYRPVEYEERLPSAMIAADVVVCRAGAMSIAELAVLGAAAVLVPLPGAPGDHQTANARALSQAGAAVLVPDAQCDGRTLEETLDRLLSRPDHLASMREASRAAGKTDAAQRIAGLVDLHAAAAAR